MKHALVENSMDLDAVTFPALIVADDGWVQQLKNKEELSSWTRSAVSKYSNNIWFYTIPETAHGRLIASRP